MKERGLHSGCNGVCEQLLLQSFHSDSSSPTVKLHIKSSNHYQNKKAIRMNVKGKKEFGGKLFQIWS